MGNYNNPTQKVFKILFAIYGQYEINWFQVILNELFSKNFSKCETYLTHVFNYFGIDLKGEETIPRKIFDKANISLMHISPFLSLMKRLRKRNRGWRGKKSVK